MNHLHENAFWQSKTHLIRELKTIHTTFRLSSSLKTDLLTIPNNQLSYLLSILKNENSINAPFLEEKEWDDFINFLNIHFITPFIYYSLTKLPIESRPPTDTFEKMRLVYLKGVSRNIKMENLLKTLLDIANKNNIQILVLKGPAVARTIYDNPVLRHSTDIDILVKPDDIIRLREIIKNMGYYCIEKKIDLYRNGYSDEEYYPTRNGAYDTIIEVHWKLYPYYQLNRFDYSLLFSRAINVESKELSFKTLDFIDSLIYTAMHMVYGHTNVIQLKWIVDISLLGKTLSTPDDWIELQKRCINQGARLAIEKALLMAQLWTDFRIPTEFEDFSKWPEPSKDEIKNFTNIINHNILAIFQLIVPEDIGFIEKARIIIRWIFPPIAVISGTNSSSKLWLLPGLYIKRWWWLINK